MKYKKNIKTFAYMVYKYNNSFDKVTIKKKLVKLRRVNEPTAKEFLTKKYIDTKKFDFIEREY